MYSFSVLVMEKLVIFLLVLSPTLLLYIYTLNLLETLSFWSYQKTRLTSHHHTKPQNTSMYGARQPGLSSKISQSAAKESTLKHGRLLIVI